MNIFHRPGTGSIIITKPLPRRMLEVADRLEYDFADSVLDPILDTQVGYIPIKDRIRYYDSYKIRSIVGYDINPWTTIDRVVSILRKKGIDPDNCIHTTENDYVMIPPGINKQFITDTGVAVLDDMQRSANALVEYYISYRPTVIMNMRYQSLITDYIDSISNVLLGKSRLMDKLTGCIHPISGRAVISCNPTLPIDVVGIPAKMINKWMHNEEFRDIYNLPDDDIKVAYHRLKNRLVIVLRQPIHDRGSIVSMRMNIVNGTTIQINPIIVAGVFQGDYDGDTAAVLAPITKEGINALPNMYIGKLLNNPFTKICKEIRFSQPNEYSNPHEYLPNDINLANSRARELFASTTDGYSISYKDIVGDGTGSNPDSRFNHILSSEQQHTLHDIANGLSLSQIFSAAEDDMNGLRNGSAIEGYRVIKGATARTHGAMNSAMALAFALYWRNDGISNSNDERSHSNGNGNIHTSYNQDDGNMYRHDSGGDTEIKEGIIDGIISNDRNNADRGMYNRYSDSISNIQYTNQDSAIEYRNGRDRTQELGGTPYDNGEFTEIIRDLATIKRMLAGAGLSSKHGGECKATDNRAKLIQQIFYTPERDGWTDRDQVFRFLTDECNLPAKETNTLLDVIWTTPPSNINSRLRQLSPSYMMTRRGARLDLLDGWDRDNTITQYFYDKE